MKSVKGQIVAAFLLAAYLGALALPYFPIAYYYWNQSYIAEELCVNKDQPEMCCMGSCYLKTQLEAAEPAAEDAGAPAEVMRTLPWAFLPEAPPRLPVPEESRTAYRPAPTPALSDGYAVVAEPPPVLRG